MGPSSHIKHARYNNKWGRRTGSYVHNAHKLALANAKVSHKHRKAIEAAAPTEDECLWSKS